MSLALQQTIVAVIVLGCVAHLAWLGWRMMRSGKSSCGSCGSCANAKDGKSPAVVTIDTLRKSAERR